MNNVFNIDRFGKYFLYDLKNAKNNYLASFIVCACLPLILYLGSILTRIISVGFTEELWLPAMGSFTLRIFAVFLAFLIVILTFPVKQYGKLTDKRYGSDWLMIPASTLEKFLSMLLLVCVVMPLALSAGLFITDGLLCLITPGHSETVASMLLGQDGSSLMEELDVPFKMNIVFPLYLNFCENVLFFTLGALIFRKSKTALSILAGFAVIVLLFSLTFAIFGTVSIDSQTVMSWFQGLDVNHATFWLNFWVNLIYLVIFAILDAGLYFRLKTLKH